MTVLTLVGPRKVRVSREGVASFNRAWPCSELRSTRAYWFEYDADGDLVDSDVPEKDDGPAASAMCDDCKAWLFDDETPDWAPGNPGPFPRLAHVARRAYWEVSPGLYQVTESEAVRPAMNGAGYRNLAALCGLKGDRAPDS